MTKMIATIFQAFLISCILFSLSCEQADTCSHTYVNITMASYQKAHSLLESAVETHGGKERIESIRSIDISWEGKRIWRNQSPSPDPPYTKTDEQRRIVIDLDNERVIQEMRGAFVGGGIYLARGVKNKDKHFLLSMEDSLVFHQDRFGLANYERLFRLSPNLILKQALKQASTLRLLGEERIDGSTYAVISFVWDGEPVSIYVNKDTYRLYKLQRTIADATTGDTTVDEIFTDYTEKQGLLVPTSRTRTIGSVPVLDFDKVATSINQPIDSKLFELPSYYRPYMPETQSPKSRVNQISSNLYMYEDPTRGYNTLFADFGDYIFVMEPPLSSAVSEPRIDKIKETIPDKPIRFIGVTHFHSDHSGGLRPFIAEGATLITTKNNRDFFEDMVTTPFTLNPDRLSQKPMPLQFRFVEDHQKLETDINAVRFYHLPPYGHVEEMLVAWFPEPGFLFTGDLIHVTFGGELDIATSVAHRELMDLINSKNIEPNLIGTVHGGIIPFDEFQKAFSLNEQTVQQ